MRKFKLDSTWNISSLAQLIRMNGGWSIGELSEEPLEANKFVRRYLNQFARTTAPIEQLTDVMNRLNERSNPEVVHRQKQLQKLLICDICGENTKLQTTTCLYRIFKKIW